MQQRGIMNVNQQQHIDQLNELRSITDLLTEQNQGLSDWQTEQKKAIKDAKDNNEDQLTALEDILSAMQSSLENKGKGSAGYTDNPFGKSKDNTKESQEFDFNNITESFSGLISDSFGFINKSFKNNTRMTTSIFKNGSGAISKILGGIGKALTMSIGLFSFGVSTAISGLIAFGTKLIDLNENFNTLNQLGFSFQGGLKGLQTALNNAGLDVDKMSSILVDNNKFFARIGSKGLKDFTDQLGELRKSGSFAALGLTAEEGADQLANYLDIQRLAGQTDLATKMKDTAAQTAYIEHMTTAARTMGVSVKELQADMKSMFDDADTASYLSGMDEKTRLEAQAILSTMKGVPDAVKEDMLRVSQGLQPLSAEYTALLQSNESFRKANDNFTAGVANNNLSLESFKNVALATVDDAKKARDQAVGMQLDTADASHAWLTSLQSLSTEAPDLQRDAVQTTIQGAKGMWADLSTTFKNDFTDFVASLFQADTYTNFFSNAFKGLVDKFFSIEADKVPDFSAAFTKMTTDFASKISTWGSNLATDGKELATGIANKIDTIFGGGTADLFDYVSTSFKSGMKKIGEYIDNNDWLKMGADLLKSIGSFAIDTGTGAIESISNAFGGFKDAVLLKLKNMIRDVVATIPEWLMPDFVFDWLNEPTAKEETTTNNTATTNTNTNTENITNNSTVNANETKYDFQTESAGEIDFNQLHTNPTNAMRTETEGTASLYDNMVLDKMIEDELKAYDAMDRQVALDMDKVMPADTSMPIGTAATSTTANAQIKETSIKPQTTALKEPEPQQNQSVSREEIKQMITALLPNATAEEQDNANAKESTDFAQAIIDGLSPLLSSILSATTDTANATKKGNKQVQSPRIN